MLGWGVPSRGPIDAAILSILRKTISGATLGKSQTGRGCQAAKLDHASRPATGIDNDDGEGRRRARVFKILARHSPAGR